ncbi:MAG TPA: hypothetical protein PKY19_04305, partial [Oscillospiraceae bacterium]|nr:hypothetical protein [Oscillospiraceae bacterium]
ALGAALNGPIARYRQALRDLPDDPNWPDLQPEDWPKAPEGTDADLLYAGEPEAGENVTISDYEKNGVRVTFFCENDSGSNAGIAVPLLYYRYYSAKTESGDSLTCYAGDNNVLTVAVPPDFDGTVTVDFHEPVSWRAAEAVSAVTLLFVVWFCAGKKRKTETA